MMASTERYGRRDYNFYEFKLVNNYSANYINKKQARVNNLCLLLLLIFQLLQNFTILCNFRLRRSEPQLFIERDVVVGWQQVGIG